MNIEQTLTSLEVAEMVRKEHGKLIRDLRRYEKQLAEAKIGSGDFFTESTYLDANNQSRPCYNITKKGCEFIAHKLTGTKGTIFTASYINRFHEMENIIQEQKKIEEFPWFIKKFRGKYVVLERDFITITGVDIRNHKSFYRMELFRGGYDYNGYGWYKNINKEDFKEKYGFEFGDDKVLMYFYLCGVRKAIEILQNDNKVKMNTDAVKTIKEGFKQLMMLENSERAEVQKTKELENGLPIQINIIVGKTQKA